MALIIDEEIDTGYLDHPDSSGIMIRIDPNLLSIPYNLNSRTIINGKILSVWDEGDHLIEELKNKEIRFIFKKTVSGSSYLFLSKESWELLRDYGILPGKGTIKIKLDSIEKGSETIDIYSKRDVIG